jgi:hypothetical protein
MGVFLDQLKTRMEEAHKRLQTSQQKASAAQAEYQAAGQEFNSLQLLVNLELARATKSSSTAIMRQAAVSGAEINKTDLVRDLIIQHPAVITPPDIWKQVGSQLGRRQYLYSVLKRLKDRDEIVDRKGKYVAKAAVKPEGNAPHQQGLVQ